jgi:hypothetical protein
MPPLHGAAVADARYLRLAADPKQCYLSARAMVVEEARPSNHLCGATPMIFLGILVSLAAIGTMCWLLFNLAVFALPFFAGVTLGTWAYGTGAGWLGATVIGLAGAGLVLALGQGLLLVVRPLWARFLIALAFVAPAGVAGFHAALGITRLLMPSEAWQVVSAIIGAVAVGITAFLRVAGMAAPGNAGGSLVRG